MLIWGLTDGSAGMVSQVRGVGEALAQQVGGEFVLKQARRMWPFCLLPGTWWKNSLWLKTLSSDPLQKPWPDVLITSGRRSVAFALAIKHASKGKTKRVHLQNPRVALKHFDLVVPMEHDDVSGDNIYPTFAALHHITSDKLSMAAYEFQDQIDHYPMPRVAIFIGGTTNKYTLTSGRMEKVIAMILEFAKQHEGSLFISSSRRTGGENTQLLQGKTEGLAHSWFYTSGEPNPYLAWLAAADALVVTNDSVSMMSEALATGKPLYILPLPDHEDTKPARFARQLIARSMAKPFGFPLAPYEPEMVNECDAVVEEIVQLLK